jgi:DNA-binding transcriptional LysR family regulator
MDRLEAMAILVASAEEGGFTAAGRKLGIPLPTVSRKVGELENRLKTKLFIRSTRKLILTEAGASYVAACKRILEYVGEAEAEAVGEYNVPRGELTLSGGDASFGFGPLYGRGLARHDRSADDRVLQEARGCVRQDGKTTAADVGVSAAGARTATSGARCRAFPAAENVKGGLAQACPSALRS